MRSYSSFTLTLLRLVFKPPHVAPVRRSLSRRLTSSFWLPRHSMLVCPTSHLTDGPFCLICHPTPTTHPSHLLCSSLSRILGPFGSGSDAKHMGSPDFWVTSEIYCIRVSLTARFLIRSMQNVRSSELYSELLLWRISSTLGTQDPSSAPCRLSGLSFPPTVSTLCVRRIMPPFGHIPVRVTHPQLRGSRDIALQCPLTNTSLMASSDPAQ